VCLYGFIKIKHPLSPHLLPFQMTIKIYFIQIGIYVIIDWHNAGDGGYDFGNGVSDFNAFINNAVDFFYHMSRIYAGVPNVLYELWSEPAWLDWHTIKWYHYNVMTVSIFII
jgi:endoglucanase